MMKQRLGTVFGCSFPFKKMKNPTVFVTSPSHTGILIAVSLLRGEKIGYLKTLLSSSHSLHLNIFSQILLSLLLFFLSFFFSCSFFLFSLFVFFSTGFCFLTGKSPKEKKLLLSLISKLEHKRIWQGYNEKTTDIFEKEKRQSSSSHPPSFSCTYFSQLAPVWSKANKETFSRIK